MIKKTLVLYALLIEFHFKGCPKTPRCEAPRRFSPAGQAGNPESGVATNKERHLATPPKGAGGALGCTLQRRGVRETKHMGVFRQPELFLELPCIHPLLLNDGPEILRKPP